MYLSDNRLIKISLVGFLVCFMLLFYLDYTYELDVSNIEDIDLSSINAYVKIDAKIISQSLINKNIFLEIKDNTGKIKAMSFDTNFKLDETKKYYIVGKVSLYKGELELIIDEIILQI